MTNPLIKPLHSANRRCGKFVSIVLGPLNSHGASCLTLALGCFRDVNLDSLRIQRGLSLIPSTVLRNCEPKFSPVLTRLCRLSISSGQFSKIWNLETMLPTHKKGIHAVPPIPYPSNYPIVITS